MAAGVRAEGDSQMEEMEDHGLGMDETVRGLLMRGPSPREGYHSDALLAPDTDFMTDDHSSAASGMDVADRLTYLEQRMQMQEDEIQLLKMALADVLKRLNLSEEHQASASAGRRGPASKARPVSLTLPSKPPMAAAVSSATSLKKNSTLPSTNTARNYSLSPTPPKSSGKGPAGSVKDSPCSSKITKVQPTSAASTCKKAPDSSSKSKESAVSVGSRRVTHCKVTMQICLSPLTRRTGSSETAKSAPTMPADATAPPSPPSAPQAKGGAKPEARRRTPAFTLPLQKTTSSQNTPLDTSSYKSPLKSPSQYFQICY